MADEPRSPSPVRSLLPLGAIFLLGMLCGAALFHIGQRSVLGPPHHRGPHGAPMRQLTRELDLDDQQRERIAAIVGDSRRRVGAVLDSTHAEIRELLRPDQQERFDRLRRRRHP